jgi:hypothetical protein
LVNVTLLLDIIKMMKEMMERDDLPLLSKMHCVITAFEALKLQGLFPCNFLIENCYGFLLNLILSCSKFFSIAFRFSH